MKQILIDFEEYEEEKRQSKRLGFLEGKKDVIELLQFCKGDFTSEKTNHFYYDLSDIDYEIIKELRKLTTKE